MRNAEIISTDCTLDENKDLNHDAGNPAKRKLARNILGVVAVLGTIAISIAMIYHWEFFEQYQKWGYLSAFIFGFIACSCLPTPYLVVTFTLGGILNPTLVGLASGMGAGIGGSLMYLVGSSGKQILAGFFQPYSDLKESTRTQRLYERLQRWAHRRGSFFVFLISAAFNPVFAPMAIALGSLRFGFRRFFFWCVAGNIVKSIIIAYCGYFGLNVILNWIGG